MGALDLSVPQTRDSQFYPSILEKGMRSERALVASVAEMYFQGVSTRKVTQVMEELCGFEITSTQVSNCTKQLDEELKAWRERPFDRNYRYVYLDAIYEKIRYEGCVRSCAVLVAIGINDEGQRDILGLSIQLSEAELHWRGFLQSLHKRGLQGTKLFISDAHTGLKAARQAVFPSVPWQRCHFHLAQNAQNYVSKKADAKKVGKIIRNILTAETLEEAQQRLSQAIKTLEDMPQLAAWMEENIPEGFAHFKFEESHHRKIRTSNMLERLNKEIRRRTRKVGVFPNTASCERLISAVLMEQADEWLTNKKYLVF
jgi:transposase-like protein